MKKLVSLVTILCMALSLCIIPAAATEPTLSVGTIAEGEVYTEGANIVLTADVSEMSDVKNVDLYANGDKLPGTLIGGNGSLIWYSPAADDYAVKAVATTTAGATVESAVVNIKVESAADIIEVAKMDSADDVKQWKSGAWESTAVAAKDSNVSDDFAAYGSKSLYIKDISYGKNTNIVNSQLDTEIIKDYDLYLVFYSKADVGNYNFFAYEYVEQADGTLKSVMITRNTTTGVNKEIKQGWNVHRLPMANFVGKKVNKVVLSTYGYNCSGSGETGDTYKNAELYISGVYLAKSAPAAPTVTNTSIPANQDKVCNNLSKYRINFSEAIAKSTAKAAVSVKKSDDSAVTEGVTINAGADYIDVLFAEGALAHNETYTIEISNALASSIGGSFAGATYKFSTTDDACTDAKPIASVVYPEAGANVATSTKLAAKVIFNGNVSKVEFYKGTELLGEATNYTGNEYVLDNATLAEGANAIKAVATLNDNSTVESAEITVNAAPATEYAIHGIENGERILINDKDYRTISVINASDVHKSFAANTGFLEVPDATGISKVTFILDDKVVETTAKSPYQWNMPLTDVNGTHTLNIKVLDSLGTVTNYGPYTYTTVYGDVYSSSFRNFEDGNVAFTDESMAGSPSDEVKASFTSSSVADPTNADNTMAKVDGKYYTSGVFKAFNSHMATPLKSNLPTAARMLRFTYDFRVNNIATRVVFQLRDTFTNNNYTDIMDKASNCKIIGNNVTYKCVTDVDLDTGIIVTYVNGVEFMRKKLSSTKFINTENIIMQINLYSWTSTPEFYFDNVGVTYYTHRTGALDVEKEGTTVKAINTNAAAEGIKVITATYNGNQLADVVIDDVTVPANGIFNKEYTVGANDKLFVWKDFVTLKPLTE